MYFSFYHAAAESATSVRTIMNYLGIDILIYHEYDETKFTFGFLGIGEASVRKKYNYER